VQVVEKNEKSKKNLRFNEGMAGIENLEPMRLV